jgi:hypothetical protein
MMMMMIMMMMMVMMGELFWAPWSYVVHCSTAVSGGG